MKINGTYKILYIKVSGNYFPIGCLTSNSFEETADMMPTTVRGSSNGWQSSRPTKQRYSISFSGIMDIENENIVSFRDLQGYKRNRTLLEWKIESSEGDDIDYGSGHINSLSDTAEMESFISFSGGLEGFGEPLILEGNRYIDSDYITDYYE